MKHDKREKDSGRRQKRVRISQDFPSDSKSQVREAKKTFLQAPDLVQHFLSLAAPPAESGAEEEAVEIKGTRSPELIV